MVSSSTRRMSWRALAPIVAIAAVGLTACSNNEEPTDVPGTTPPVWTGSAAPEASGHGESHGSETGNAQAGAAQGGTSAGASALTADLKTVDGASAGTVSFAEQDGDVQVTIDVEGLAPGYHGVHVHAVGKCEPESVAPTGGAPGSIPVRRRRTCRSRAAPRSRRAVTWCRSSSTKTERPPRP